MPELPEVEVLVRHLRSRLPGKTIRSVEIRDRRSLRQIRPRDFTQTLRMATFESVHRRGKYLVFTMRKQDQLFPLIGHLGMTGRLYLAPRKASLPRHATLIIALGTEELVFEDARRFGGMTLDTAGIERLGPEPLESTFAVESLKQALARSRQAIKIKLLDQSVVAGIGNIYASEALFLARIHPETPAHRLTRPTLRRLHDSIRRVLREAIRFGSTLPLNFGAAGSGEALFYYGQSTRDVGNYVERLRVYDREGQPCVRCRTALRKLVQAARSTYFCPRCQRKPR